MTHDQLHDIFTQALAAVPDPYRRLLVLSDAGPLAAAADALGLTRAEARIELLHARQALRAQLAACVREVTHPTRLSIPA